MPPLPLPYSLQGLHKFYRLTAPAVYIPPLFISSQGPFLASPSPSIRYFRKKSTICFAAGAKIATITANACLRIYAGLLRDLYFQAISTLFPSTPLLLFHFPSNCELSREFSNYFSYSPFFYRVVEIKFLFLERKKYIYIYKAKKRK